MNKLRISLPIVIIALLAIGCDQPAEKANTEKPTETMEEIKEAKVELSNKDKAVALLESLETGDHTPVSYINPDMYIQHNLGVADGLAGFGEVMKHVPEGGFKAKVIRAFEDGDFVFTHTEYDFFGPKVGFDVFRFENGLIVEHWDNLSPITPPNPSGRTQLDGPTEENSNADTEANRALIKNCVTDVFLEGKMDKLTDYFSTEKYEQHNSAVADGLDGLGAAMEYMAANGQVMIYEKLHRVLAQNDFVLTMSEGKFGKGEHVAFYDLFRIEDGKITEHWDVIQNIPAKAEWKNTNGKF